VEARGDDRVADRIGMMVVLLEPCPCSSSAFTSAVTSANRAIDRRVTTLAALRKARGLTQAQLTDDLGMTQGEISRLERRENLHLATLARFIEATGGRLRITAVYDDDEVEVGIGDLTDAAAGPEWRPRKSSQKTHGPAGNSGQQRGTPGSSTNR
jgi:transcriptional regulator with XRE-family HTH domain